MRITFELCCNRIIQENPDWFLIVNWDFTWTNNNILSKRDLILFFIEGLWGKLNYISGGSKLRKVLWYWFYWGASKTKNSNSTFCIFVMVHDSCLSLFFILVWTMMLKDAKFRHHHQFEKKLEWKENQWFGLCGLTSLGR